jgi:hypothetical protein
MFTVLTNCEMSCKDYITHMSIVSVITSKVVTTHRLLYSASLLSEAVPGRGCRSVVHSHISKVSEFENLLRRQQLFWIALLMNLRS